MRLVVYGKICVPGLVEQIHCFVGVCAFHLCVARAVFYVVEKTRQCCMYRNFNPSRELFTIRSHRSRWGVDTYIMFLFRPMSRVCVVRCLCVCVYK